MTDEDWKATTWRENRRRQHHAFYALGFRDKMKVIEEVSEVANLFRGAKGSQEETPPDESGGDSSDGDVLVR